MEIQIIFDAVAKLAPLAIATLVAIELRRLGNLALMIYTELAPDYEPADELEK